MSERISFYDQIRNNKIKSVLLISLIIIVFFILGYFVSYAFTPDYFFIIMILSIIISIFYVVIGYYKSDKIALASVNAKPALRSEYSQYYHIVEGLTIASGIPMPKLYVMNNEQINAFATGRDPKNSIICVTTGALKNLNKQELEGVLAHELSHIANYDIRFMTLTAVLVGMIAIIAELFLRSFWFRGSSDRDNKGNMILILIGIVFAILAPIVVRLIQLAISRKREYVADASGVKFTRYPKGLADALRKIEKDHPTENKKINKAVAPLFISDPFKRKIQGLFSTHPPLTERIRILERM
ncbi:MAG: M48 family metallopeptidase [Nanoarchaeota archaeon]|nr:M48 family metallopeptidase [Nanoarchaeota archaeon]